MFEGLVKRLLDTYLAPYVDGITQNLQMAVWSGNISLENLTLKDDITSRLALPFHDVSGRIGSMNIRIPWASLGTTPIKILIDSVYICIDNRSNEKTDAEILAHLRKKKNNLISILEHEYFELANLQSEGKLSSSYIIKLSQKILNNIQIDITNIHLQFFDEHSSFAFKIDSIFVRKSRGDETKKSLRLKTNEEFREEPVTHVCSLLGFSIYETNFDIPKHEVNSKNILQVIIDRNSADSSHSDAAGSDGYIGLLMLEPLSFRLYLAINPKNKSIYASLCIGSITSAQSRLAKVIDYTNALKNNITSRSSKGPSEASSRESEKEQDDDMLKIVLTSDVIRTFTKMWVDINMDRKRGKRILLSKANEVKLDHDSLKTTTKAEFIKLYTKYKLSSTQAGANELDSEELGRLQDLVDLVPARYIARWKFACKRRSSAQVVTKENKSWFKWAKNIVTTTYTNYQTNRSVAKAAADQPGASEEGEKDRRRSFRPSFFSLNLNNSFAQQKLAQRAEDGSEGKSEESREPELEDAQEPEQSPKESSEPVTPEKNAFEPDLSTQVVVENLPGGLVLTEEEIKMIQETISLEELFDDSFTTSSYYFECVLPSFQFIIKLLSHGSKFITDEDNVILIDIQNLQSRLFMHAVMDMKDRDRYEGYFDLNLDSFDVILKDRKIMTFSQQTTPFQSIVDTYIDPAFPYGAPQAAAVSSEQLLAQRTQSASHPDHLQLVQSISVVEKCIINLRTFHKITPQGNVLIVNGELRPIETNIFPDLISVFFELISLFKPIKNIFEEDFNVDTYSDNAPVPSASISSIPGSAKDEDEDDDLLHETHVKFDTTREIARFSSKDMDRIHFVNFDIKFSAPILILYYENTRIDLYFGTLALKSNGDCPISHIDGTLELKQTQITCNYMDKGFNFLRPLPVKIHYDLDLKNELINLNVIFEEIFAQLEPLATGMLFKIPNEIVKIVAKNMMQESQPAPGAAGADSGGGWAAYQANNRLKNYRICSNVLIRHSGFSVSNLDLHEVFKLDMYNVSIKLANTLTSSNFNLTLESIIISNPTTKIPLFKTINPMAQTHTHSLNTKSYNDRDLSIGDLNIGKFPSLGSDGPRSARETSDFEDEFVDAIEDVSKSLDLEVITDLEGDFVRNAVNVYIIEMEGNWEYSTIKLVADCFQEYTEIFNTHLKDSSFFAISSTFKTFKDKFMFTNQAPPVFKQAGGEDGVPSKNKNIRGMMIQGELPALESEKRGLEVITKYKLVIKGASVVFNNSAGDVIAKLSVERIIHQLSKFQNQEKIMKLSIQTGRLYFGGRCILSHLESASTNSDRQDRELLFPEKLMTREQQLLEDAEVRNNLLELTLKTYKPEAPYSICFQGRVDRVVFVFFQHDINRFLEYFDDGILSVFLSKSYHRVVERAEHMYFFYQFSVTSPIFVLPENKAAIPNADRYYKHEIPPGSTLPLYTSGDSPANNNRTLIPDGEECRSPGHSADPCSSPDSHLRNIANVVDLWYFGSYVLFELGQLEFKNTYSELIDRYKSTILLNMFGTRAQIVEQPRGTAGISGVFLDHTDLKVCTRGRDLMEIGIDSAALVTRLTRNQITFLIDVFNENVGGAAYMLSEPGTTNFAQNFPTKSESRYLMRLSLRKFQLYCYNNLGPSKEGASAEGKSGSSEGGCPGGEIIPLGLFEFTDVTCCLDYASNNVKLLSYYQFGFISKSLTITDLRENSFNKYKTLLRCNNQAGTMHGDLLSFDEDDASDVQKCVKGLLFEWLRDYKTRTGTDFFKINPECFSGQWKAGASAAPEQEDAIKCVIVSDPEESVVDVIVSNSEIPLLFVFFFDLVRFFSLSYGTSSMALFPKISQVNVERVYLLNLLVSKSKFISFSKMDRIDCPRLELVTDFLLQMHMQGNSFKFTKMDIIDCLLSRVYPNTNISQVLCANFLMYGKGHYLSEVASRMFFQFTIPQINLMLYTRDLSIIIYCFKSMFTDGPSVIPVKLVNNELIDDNSSKYLTLSFDIKGLEMLFFDDLKKSIVPLVKFTVESEKLEIVNLPIEKRYSLMRCNCHLYYFNTNVGDWEPFIEKFIFNLEYITNPAANPLPQNALNSRVSSQLNMSKATRVSDDNVWKDFVSEYLLKITCNNNLLVNMTPTLCQLMLYFLPILKSNLLQSPYLNNPNNVDASQAGEGASGSKDTEEEDIELYNYRYINLTSYEYYGFIMDTSKPRSDAFSDVLNITTTTKPRQLDSLVNQLHKEVSSSDYCICLVTRPPSYVLKRIARDLRCNQQLVENDLLTTASILRTKSNLSNSSYASSTVNSGELNRALLFNNGIVISNIPLAKNSTVLLSIPIKDISMFNVLSNDEEPDGALNGPAESKGEDEDVLTEILRVHAPFETTLSGTNLVSGRSSTLTNSDVNSSTVSAAMTTGRTSNITLNPSGVPTARISNATNAMGISRNNRITNVSHTITNNNIICQVLSPHPSHKLLLFTSTVRIYNKSGLPIVMCFLDQAFNQQYMYNLNHRTIPCNILNQSDMQNFKQYTSSTVYSDLREVRRHSEDAAHNEEDQHGHYIVIPNDYMLSVPENVFLSDSQVIFSFKPLYLQKDRDDPLNRLGSYKSAGFREGARPEYNKLVNKSGWCKVIDSSHHVGTRVRQCYCPDLSNNGFLYFVVSVNNKRSSLPANVTISEVVIYPSVSIMNTLPLDLDVKLLSKDYNLQNTRYSREGHRDKDDIMYRMHNKSILHIYSVPPNESLSMYIRLAAAVASDQTAQTNSSEWSTRIDNIYGNSDSKSVINIGVNSSFLELELIRFPGALPVNNLCIQGHLSLIINAPWLFIDRTGLALVPQHISRVYTINNLSFLYDNNNSNNYKLVSLNNANAAPSRQSVYLDRGYRNLSSSGYRPEDYMDESEYDIKMPIIGGYVYTSIDIKGKKHCLCLTTEKVYIPGLSHISSKVTSALPEYLFTNNLSEVVYLRKDTRSQSMQIMPNSTQSISHLTHVNFVISPSNAVRDGEFKENCIEIKVGMETCWSNVIYLSEAYSGETFMSFARENSSKSQVYNISIIPKNGIKYIAINPILTPTPNALSSLERGSDMRGYLLYNNCSHIKVVMIRTFHKTDVRNGSCFTAKYGQVIQFGWPNPFVHKSKLVQVLLWLDKNTVAPSKPLIFNFSTPSFRFRRIELTTPEYHTNYNITIMAENRIDYYIIIINPNVPEPGAQIVPPRASELARMREQDRGDAEEIDDGALLTNTDKNINDIKNEDLYVFEEESTIKSYQVVLQISQIGVSIVSQSMHEELFFLEMGGIMCLFMRKEDNQRLELKITDVQLDNQTELEMGRTILVNRAKVETCDASFLHVYVDRPFSNSKDICVKKMFVSLDDLQVDFNDLLVAKVHSYYKECMINLFNDTTSASAAASSYSTGYQGSYKREGYRGEEPRPGSTKIDIEVIEKWLLMERESATSSIEVNVRLPRSISIDYLYIEAFSLVVWCCFELDKLHMLGDLMRMGLRILSVSRNFELMGAPLSFQREYVSISRTSVLSFWEQMKDKYLQACLSCIGSILGYSNLLNIPKLPLTVGRCTIELAADAVDSVSSGLGMVLSKFTFDKEYMKRRSAAKEVTGIKDGLFSAGKTIGEGLFSLTNIVTKPIEGAQKEGVGGFIKGLGKGLVGSIVKPIDKVGIAVSQVSRGIKANISKEEKFLVGQCRRPRMLWGEFAQIRPYSAQDAEIKHLLGNRFAKHIMDCLLIMKQQSTSGGKQVALLFYPSKVYLVDLTQSSQSQGTKPYTIWRLQISNITDVRASSHGVIIKCGSEQYQVPCTRADMINNIHSSFQRAIKHASSQLTIGPELFKG